VVQSGLPTVKTSRSHRSDPALQSPFLLNQVGARASVVCCAQGAPDRRGRLGSPTALYLAAAGVGTLGLMDGDVVDITNLQRQVLHTTRDVGKLKVESGTRTLKGSTRVKRDSLPFRIHRRQRDGRHQGLTTRRRRLRHSRRAIRQRPAIGRQTNVHGSIIQFEGMATVSRRTRGRANRCLYPTRRHRALSLLSEAGVLGGSQE